MNGRVGGACNGPRQVTGKLQIGGKSTVEMVVLGLVGEVVLQVARQRMEARPRMLGESTRIVPRTQKRIVPKVGTDGDCRSVLWETLACSSVSSTETDSHWCMFASS